MITVRMAGTVVIIMWNGTITMATGMCAFMWIAIMGTGMCIFTVRTVIAMDMFTGTMVTGMCIVITGMATEATGRITAGMVVTAEAMDMVTARMVTAIEMDGVE
jgi:hypothetical protein